MRSATALLVAGCAYYNGLYNANQLVKEAHKAEAQHRLDDARSFWAQAAVKAESVAARHPNSKYRDDALFIQGEAFVRSGECGRAVLPLTEVVATSSALDLRERAGLMLGQCLFSLRSPNDAIVTLTPVAGSQDTARASEALFWRGRSFALAGRYDAALRDLQASNDARAWGAVAVAAAHGGRYGVTVDAVHKMRDAAHPTGTWLALLDTLGGLDVATGSRALDGVLSGSGLTGNDRASLLVGDGLRWAAAGDNRRAAARFDAALAEDPADSIANRARFARALAGVGGVSDPSGLFDLGDTVRLLEFDDAGLETWRQSWLGAVEEIKLALAGAQTVNGGLPPDLRLFLAGELARDSLGSAKVAYDLFGALQYRYPRSPIAPKAMLAQAHLRPDRAVQLVQRVEALYPDSPYTLILHGGHAERFTVVEDSIRRVIEKARSR